MNKIKHLLFYLFLLSIVSCSKSSDTPETPIDSSPKELTIFCVNDVHGQLENFSKIKHIIDLERQETNVLVVSAGDLFSGNPVVDNHPQKGYPMIDVMNRIGFDVAVLGNHEFDYGQKNLTDRINQSEFDWIGANIDMGTSGVPQPLEFTTINKENIKITLLGLVETNGKEDETIPSTHPWRVKNITFNRPEDVVSLYSNTKKEEDSDLYIALTHLGIDGNEKILGDSQLASKFPYFDLIIGGHSHSKAEKTVNKTPIFQAGGNLKFLRKITLTIVNKKIENISSELIELSTYQDYDSELKDIIDNYSNQDYLTEIIGNSLNYHDRASVGCFYTDALRLQMNVDISFQNTGGIRSSLNEGDITKREIFEISPFNNGTVIYEMTVGEIKRFLIGSGSGFYYSGIELKQIGQDIEVKNTNGETLQDDEILRIGINDYIPAVHDTYFPENGAVQSLTAAETIITYLEEINNQVDYTNCNRYFRMK